MNVEKNLCHRCGACFAVCPEKAILPDSLYFPKIKKNLCSNCGLCADVCPGLDLDLPRMNMKLFGKTPEDIYLLGNFERTFVASSTDERISSGATSGGALTGLLVYLLRSQLIEGAAVVKESSTPYSFRYFLASSEAELMKSSQSKYTVVDASQIFKTIMNVKNKIAFVGLPCHVHALRKLENLKKDISEKIFIVLGLYCGRTIEEKGTLALLQLLNIKKSQIKKIEYRGGQWPGEFKVFLDNGKYKAINKDIFRIISRLYTPTRCLTCFDYSNELSDLSFADAWLKDSINWKYPEGKSIILQRSNKASGILKDAQRKGYIQIEEIDKRIPYETHKGSISSRKVGAVIRIKNMRNKNLKVPNYHLKFNHQISKEKIRNEFIASVSMFCGKLSLLRGPILILYYFILKNKDKKCAKSIYGNFFTAVLNKMDRIYTYLFKW